MLKKPLILRILLISILVLVSYSFLSFYSELPAADFKSSIDEIYKIQLKNGDLVFRRGISLESQIVLLSDSQSEFSHVGIIYKINSEPFVIHSVPAESDDKDEFIKIEKLESFLTVDKASRFALYRVKNKTGRESQTASEFAYDCYSKKYCFDNDYDLNSDSKLYCTELIWKAYKYAGIDLVNDRFKSIDFIMINKKMIMPGSIIQSKLLENIYTN